MKKIYSKTGDLLELKNTISILKNFTGFIKIDNGKLFYRDSKLILSTYFCEESDIKTILKNLPEIFSIEVYECLDNELNELIRYELNKKNRDVDNPSTIIKNSKKMTSTATTTNRDFNGISVSNYLDLQKYIGKGIYRVYLKPKRYKSDEGTIVFKNGEELCAIYLSKNKILEGKKALGKIKTIFAVSDVSISITKISSNLFNNFLNTYPNSLLKTYISFDKLISTIKRKKFKLVKNDSLANILTKTPSLIEIDNNDNNDKMYIVSNEKKPIYAFFEEYDGDKAYRYIKNFCIFNDIEFKIYPLDECEFKLFKEFRENKIKLM